MFERRLDSYRIAFVGELKPHPGFVSNSFQKLCFCCEFPNLWFNPGIPRLGYDSTPWLLIRTVSF